MGYLAILGATMLWGLLAHVDRFLVNEKGNSSKDNIRALMIFSTLIAGCAMLLIQLALNGFRLPEFNLIPTLLTIAAASFYILFTYLELNAFADNDASVVVAFSQLSPVFSYAAALILLDEALSLQQIIGGIIVIIATIVLVIDFDKTDQKGEHKGRALLFILLALIAFTIYSLLLDRANSIGDYSANMIYFQIGTILPGIAFVFQRKFRDSFTRKIKRNGRKYLMLNIMNEIGNSTAVALRSFAIMFLPLALLDTLDVMGVASFTLLFGLLGTKFLPKFFDEDLSRSAIIQKVSCITLSLVGIAIIFL